MNSTLIVTGGDINLDFAREYIAGHEFSLIIAVDGGLLAAEKLGIMPDYIVGDFDTVSPLLLYKYENMESVKIIRYRPEKDFTDTYIAMNKAIEENSLCIHILGGIGSRLDHTLANIQLLQYAMENGIEGILVNEKNRVRLLGDKRKSMELKRGESVYKYVSLVPMSDKVTSVSIVGMKYNLSDYDFYLNKSISMGVSNEISDDVAKIEIVSGQLLLIESRD